ncbi:2-keto-4-pentenoate hydratase [Thermoanaerobacterium thermosaccharolyticum]|uniref:2-keto-4-pentenoate hydratase n=1 Tax=Thermoanaerobacterium thermosaccharolyticum M0795 TaxID=698948 RepID=L0INA4_THETR|nr:fumarylacetoacetate hydrolase family protein [Thermoanaerobacterium thermosaccharolyticum]AGB19452.1 2-keto-4-pentenoate hydratase [Thermoanaerobacterium thermosaccharolyticum M0795]
MNLDFNNIASKLLDAWRQQKPIEPLTDEFKDLSVEDAYKIQLAEVSLLLKEGHKVVGKKIGLTSKPMQQLLGVNEPDYGHLFEDMILLEGEPCERSKLIRPRVEGEFAFILKDRLKGPGVTIADVYRATEGIMPAIEIVDSRIRDWKIKLQDTIADNGSSAKFVLGSRMFPIEQLDLRHIGMIMEKNGELINTGTGANVLGHPAVCVAWLANKLSEFDVSLEPGEIILSGALTAALDANAGDVFTISYHTLGTLTLKFI